MNKTCVLFDLDNTLYPRECGLFHHIEEKINDYIRGKLGLTHEEATTLRRSYIRDYGFTLTGLMNQHQIDPQDYLEFVYEVDVEGLLDEDTHLAHMLSCIPMIKVVFTNATKRYAHRVLRSLGIEPFFVDILDIIFMDYMPKPHPYSFHKALGYLGVTGEECILVDDHLPNLATAREWGMTTVHVGKGRVAESDYQVGDVRELEGVFRDLSVMRKADGNNDYQGD